LFSEYFHNNLLEFGIDPTPYSTYSFRRGGCQYLCSERRWNIRKLCEWGGWSMEFESLTIIRYLLSWNNDPKKGQDFLNPDANQNGILCNLCGRKCACNSQSLRTSKILKKEI
jgi:hypothetical protein